MSSLTSTSPVTPTSVSFAFRMAKGYSLPFLRRSCAASIHVMAPSSGYGSGRFVVASTSGWEASVCTASAWRGAMGSRRMSGMNGRGSQCTRATVYGYRALAVPRRASDARQSHETCRDL